MDGEGIYKDFNPNHRASINFGYIIVPIDIPDRDVFVTDCIRKRRVSIYVEDGGGALHNCSITLECLNNIKFPDYNKGEILGSLICFFTEPFGNNAYVIGTLSKNDETDNRQENSNYIHRTSDTGSSIVTIGKDGNINIDVYGENEVNGQVNIHISNRFQKGQLNLSVKGDINLNSEGNINVDSVNGDITINCEQNVSINAAKYVLNGGTEAMLRGNKTQENLLKEKSRVDDIIKAIAESQPSPSTEPGMVYLKTKVSTITTEVDYSEIKSEVSFLK